jgi:hypothetical protein
MRCGLLNTARNRFDLNCRTCQKRPKHRDWPLRVRFNFPHLRREDHGIHNALRPNFG